MNVKLVVVHNLVNVIYTVNHLHIMLRQKLEADYKRPTPFKINLIIE